MKIWIITEANKKDLTWIISNNVPYTSGAYYCGEPCISVYPSEKQLTVLTLKFGERLTKVAITSREMIEILNPANLFSLE